MDEYDANEKAQFRAAKANWDAFQLPMERVRDAASGWAAQLKGVDRPWMCWNVNPDWCLVQQRLVRYAGWTPVIGYDPRAGEPPLLKESVLINFNEKFGFPALHMVFPLEFVFLFADRFAFWHSDLLIRKDTMKWLAGLFETLADGTTAAVDSRTGFLARLKGKRGRYWELVGCTTRRASQSQYEHGSGWWRHIAKHPNSPIDAPEQVRRAKYGYDHGVGILYWAEHYGGSVVPIPRGRVEEGHCTRVGNTAYQPQSPNDERRDLSKDLPYNYDLAEVCARLNLTEFLHAELD